MGKISIGLQGWRFDEAAVFTEDGDYRPFDELDDDDRERLIRLSVVVGAPCDACWLIHGEDWESCNEARYVYGEPLAEVLVCEEHEPDFVYWFREAGGDRYAGDDDFDDHFHEWFLEGRRAPEGYGGMEYVEVDPGDLPDPPDVDPDDVDVDVGDTEERIDLRDVDLSTDYPTS